MNLCLKFCGSQKEEDIKAHPNAKRYVLKMENIPKVDLYKWPKYSHIKNTLALDLLDKMLQFNPEKRITAEQALRHKYLEELFDEQDLKKAPKFTYRFDQSVDLKKDPEYVKREMYKIIMDWNKQNGIAGDAIMEE